MSKLRKKKRSPKQVLALPDLEQSKAAVLNSLTSTSSQRTYDRAIIDFVDWYCSEPRHGLEHKTHTAAAQLFDDAVIRDAFAR
jgi:hypothetical protein